MRVHGIVARMTSPSSPSMRYEKRGSWKSANSFLLLATRERKGLTTHTRPSRAAVDELGGLSLHVQRRAVVGHLVEGGVGGAEPERPRRGADDAELGDAGGARGVDEREPRLLRQVRAG